MSCQQPPPGKTPDPNTRTAAHPAAVAVLFCCVRHMVREIVGHSDLEVTMTIYAHTALDEKRQALANLGNALT